MDPPPKKKNTKNHTHKKRPKKPPTSQKWNQNQPTDQLGSQTTNQIELKCSKQSTTKMYQSTLSNQPTNHNIASNKSTN